MYRVGFDGNFDADMGADDVVLDSLDVVRRIRHALSDDSVSPSSVHVHHLALVHLLDVQEIWVEADQSPGGRGRQVLDPVGSSSNMY